jgi:hypothetical protein
MKDPRTPPPRTPAPRTPAKTSKPEYARLIPSNLQRDAGREGPRLIPPEPKRSTMEDHSRRYLDLADMALKPKVKKTNA